MFPFLTNTRELSTSSSLNYWAHCKKGFCTKRLRHHNLHSYTPGLCKMAVESNWKYPSVRRDETVLDEYTEEKIKVSDPYRWLEDPDSEETASFVKAQNEISRPYLDAIPERKAFHSR